MDRQTLQSLSRVDLQHKARTLGLKANLKSDKLVEEILKALDRPSATPEDNSTSEEGDQAPTPAPRSTATRTRGASAKLESASNKPKARTYARRRAESPDERAPVKRAGRPGTGHVASDNAITAAEKPTTQRKTSRAMRPLEVDSEGKDSESDAGEVEKEERTSTSTLPSRIPTTAARRQVTVAAKPGRRRKATAPVVEIVNDPPEPDARSIEGRGKDERVERKSRPSLTSRPSLGGQHPAPYVEIRRSSGGADLPAPQDATPSQNMLPSKLTPPPKSALKAPYESITSSTTRAPSTSIISPRRALDTQTIISQVLGSDEYAALKSDITESRVSIEKLKDDLDTERTRANRLESEIDVERAAATARESTLRSRLEAIETRPAPPPQVLGPEPNSVSPELEKLTHLETEFEAFKRETNGIIESHKATVSALDQHTRILEARLNKLELATAPRAPKPNYEIGTPPAPHTGKRDRDGREVEAGEDEGELTPSTQPNPSKRPRFDEMERIASPSSTTEPQQGDSGEGQGPADPPASKDTQPPTSEQSHPGNASGSGSETIDLDSIFVDTGAFGPSQNAPYGTTVNPADLTKPSPQDTSADLTSTSHSIASLRRSSTSKESTTPKLVRTSALSFGQALKAPPFPSAPTFGAVLGPSLGFGSPLSASTPAPSRDHARALSPEVSFGAVSHSQPTAPGFDFGHTFVNPAFSPMPSPAAAKPTGNGTSLHSSPTFPADTGPRTSGDYDEFGTGNTNPDSTPPPSPSKRTMYGTELTTPLRQTFGVEARSRHLAARAAVPAEGPVSEGDEDMSIDEDTAEPRASPGDVFSGIEATTVTMQQDTVGSVPSDTGPNRYGLDNPLSWGDRPPPGL